MKDYLIKINDLIVDLEAGKEAVEKSLFDIRNKEAVLRQNEERLKAVENDINAKMRIVDKYSSFENLKESAQADMAKARDLAQEAAEEIVFAREEKELAEKAKAEAVQEREIVSGKIRALKEKEAALKIREDKLKTEFIKKLEAEMKG